MLKKANAVKPVDYVMYIGDDSRNEDVFKYLNDMAKSKTNQLIPEGTKVLTCTIGRKRTCAKYFFKDPDHVLASLEKLVRPIGYEDSTKVASGLERKIKSQVNVNGMFNFGLGTATKVKGVNIRKTNFGMNSNQNLTNNDEFNMPTQTRTEEINALKGKPKQTPSFGIFSNSSGTNG
jgi:hypothetical protein